MKDWKKWVKAASIRALKTVCQTAVSLLTVGSMITDVDWVMVASTSAMAGIISLLTSLAGIPEAKDNANQE